MAAPLALGGPLRAGPRIGAGPGPDSGFVIQGGPGSIPGGAPRITTPQPFGGVDLGRVTSLHLPFGELARSPLAAAGVSVSLTAALILLVVAWVVVVARTGTRALRLRT